MNYNPNFPEKPWYKHRDPKPPKDYNPYTENDSVIAQVCKENADKLGGAEKQEWESIEAYSLRRAKEDIVIKSATLNKLKELGGAVSFVILLLLLMINSLASTSVGFLEIIPQAYHNLFSFILIFLQYALFFPVIFYIATVGKNNKTLTYFKKPSASKFYIFRWVVISFGITYGVAIIFNALFELLKALGLHINNLSTPLPIGVTENIFYGLAVVVLAPICEEILFRGILLSKLKRFGGWFAVITTGVLFGLFHQNHQQLFFATAFGIIAGFIALRTNSVIPSVIAHVCLNGYLFISGLFLTFTDNHVEYSADPSIALKGPSVILAIIGVLNILSIVITVISIAMLVTEIITNKSQFSLSRGDSGLRNGEKILAFLSNPLTIVLLLIIVSNIITYSFMDVEGILSTLEEFGAVTE